MPGYSGPLNIASLPSLYWLEARSELVNRLVIGLGFETREEVETFREIVGPRGKGKDIVGAGCDLPIDGADYFCPANIEQVSFIDAAMRTALSGRICFRRHPIAASTSSSWIEE